MNVKSCEYIFTCFILLRTVANLQLNFLVDVFYGEKWYLGLLQRVCLLSPSSPTSSRSKAYEAAAPPPVRGGVQGP